MFYARLRAGAGRGGALRQVRLEMLRGADYSHPYYRASFVAHGDWRLLEG